MKALNEKQKAKLTILKRREKVLLDNKESILKTLNPVLEDLDKIRISIDEIELEDKYR